MNNYTPGTWEVHKKNPIFITKDQKKLICTVFFDEGIEKESEANVKLIAAAPEMFEALVAIFKSMELKKKEGVNNNCLFDCPDNSQGKLCKKLKINDFKLIEEATGKSWEEWKQNDAWQDY